jgi:ADP-heptose:LPS heptosyltransferase
VTRRAVPIPPGGFRHVAVIRLSSLGDVVLTLPVVRALRGAYPDARITYWVKEEYADAVRFDPAISHVRMLERDARRIEDLVSMSAELEECDLIVDLHGNARSRVLTFHQRAPVLRARSGRVARERWVHARWTRPRALAHVLDRYAATLQPIHVAAPGTPRLAAGEEAERWGDAWMAAWGTPRPVALCPGARHFTKRWPEERWRELLGRLRGSGHAVLVFSLAGERESLSGLAADVAADPRVRWCTEPLPRMAALLSRCAAAVSNDSGLMHAAAARGLRVVALFGSTVPELGFAPAGEGHVLLRRREPCQPCALHGRAACPKRHFRCLREIGAEEVVRAVLAQPG